MGNWGNVKTKISRPCWLDGAFFIVLLLASKTLRAGCWKHSTHSSCPLGRFLCVHVFVFALLVVSWQFVCIWPNGLSISPFPAKDEPAQGQLGERAVHIWFQVLPYCKSHTSLWISRLFMIQMLCGVVHLFEGTSCVRLISMEVTSPSPSPALSPPTSASRCRKADFISEAAVFARV